MYGEGSSEEYLGEIGWQTRGIKMETKIYPSKGKGMSSEQWSHSPSDLRSALFKSKSALKMNENESLEMWYLHGPDRSVPFEDTLRKVNNLFLEGHFKRFGVSNYMAWEVAQMCEICKKNNWILPSVYQGIYNMVHRNVEPELFSCLHYYNISFYAFQPLGGGFLSDRYKKETKEVEEGSRFDPNRWQGKATRARYWNDSYFNVLEMIREMGKKHGMTEQEIALRWIMNHSMLKRENGDAIIIGASSVKHLEDNLKDLEKGPLPEEVVKMLDDAWLMVKAVASKYYH